MLIKPSGEHVRRFNQPVMNDVAEIVDGDGDRRLRDRSLSKEGKII